jgi:hypothetical protein
MENQNQPTKKAGNENCSRNEDCYAGENKPNFRDVDEED